MIWFFTTPTADLFDVYMLVLSIIVTQAAALQLHKINKEIVLGGVGLVGWSHQLLVHSQLMLRLSWAVLDICFYLISCS
jgi:hypothetical protein